MAATYSPCSRLLSFNGVDHYKEEKNMEMADTDFKLAKYANVRMMRAWRSIKRVAKRFMRRRRKIVVGVGVQLMRKVASLACVVKLKRKVCRTEKSSSNERHVLLNYDLGSYSKNFDDGKWQQEEAEYYRTRSFAFRYGQTCTLAL